MKNTKSNIAISLLCLFTFVVYVFGILLYETEYTDWKYISCVKHNPYGDDEEDADKKTNSKNKSSQQDLGELFEKYFQNPQWTTFESTKGHRIVEFNGECEYDGKPAKVKMQFIIIYYVDSFFHYWWYYRVGAIEVNKTALSSGERNEFFGKILASV